MLTEKKWSDMIIMRWEVGSFKWDGPLQPF